MKILLLILLFILVFNWLMRALFPVMMRGLMKNMQKRYGHEPPRQAPTKKEGEVTVNNVPPSQHKGTEKLGSYVDYEEVKDTN